MNLEETGGKKTSTEGETFMAVAHIKRSERSITYILHMDNFHKQTYYLLFIMRSILWSLPSRTPSLWDRKEQKGPLVDKNNVTQKEKEKKKSPPFKLSWPLILMDIKLSDHLTKELFLVPSESKGKMSVKLGWCRIIGGCQVWRWYIDQGHHGVRLHLQSTHRRFLHFTLKYMVLE